MIIPFILLQFSVASVASASSPGLFSSIKSAINTGIGSVRCTFSTCCNNWRIIKNYTGLDYDLVSKLHGQHLVHKTVSRHIKGHMSGDNPSKALVLSFHGPTGVGKNFVSRIIADNIYKDGINSPFVHLISATREFPHEEMVPFYKEQLRAWIETNVTRCAQSMFIFDEVDKLPAKLLDVIKPYIDYYEHLGGANYRKSIFLFLSNTGAGDITMILLDHLKAGHIRESLRLVDIEGTLMSSAINADNKNGLWHSQLIVNQLITAYVPFFPLEHEHVRKCILDYVNSKYRHVASDRLDVIVDEVMKEMMFYPPRELMFSSTGCKRVSDKVDYVMLDDEVLAGNIRTYIPSEL